MTNSCSLSNVGEMVWDNNCIVYLVKAYSPKVGDIFHGYEYWEDGKGEHVGIAHYDAKGVEYRYKHFMADEVPNKHKKFVERIRKNKMKSLLR